MSDLKDLVYEYEDLAERTESQAARIVDLEVQVRRFADRVTQLVWQRTGLFRLLRSIKDNGGCNSWHWQVIDRLLATGTWEDDEDSGRH